MSAGGYGYIFRRKEIRFCWTCCDRCHAEHKSLLAARVHYLWLRLTRQIKDTQ